MANVYDVEQSEIQSSVEYIVSGKLLLTDDAIIDDEFHELIENLAKNSNVHAKDIEIISHDTKRNEVTLAH